MPPRPEAPGALTAGCGVTSRLAGPTGRPRLPPTGRAAAAAAAAAVVTADRSGGLAADGAPTRPVWGSRLRSRAPDVPPRLGSLCYFVLCPWHAV